MQAISTDFQIDYDLADLTPREVAEQIIGRLEKTFSVQLMPIFKSETLTERQKVMRVKDALYNGVLQRAERENLSAFFVPPEGFTEREVSDYLISEGFGDVGVETIETEPFFVLAEKDAEKIKAYRGKDLFNYISTLTKRLEAMASAKTPGELAASIVVGGLLGIGASAGFATGQALRSGATLLAAVRTGVLRLGFGTAVSFVVGALVLLLFFLLFENPKKVLGLVINQTDEDFVVRDFREPRGNLYVNAGAIKNFMADNSEGLDSPQVQLRRRFSFGEGDEDNVVFAGFYFIDKKAGIFGAEGLALFTSTTSSLGFAHLFGSPYTKDNGTNMEFVGDVTDPRELKEIFDRLYGYRQVHVFKTDSRFELAATVNDARGGVVACVASVKAKA